VSQNLRGDASAWTTQADAALCFLQNFSNASGCIVTANIARRSLDPNTILANMHTYHAAAGCDMVTF
jgi:glucoamylase